MKSTLTLVAAIALASTAATSFAQTPAPSPAPGGCDGCGGWKRHGQDGQGPLASLNLTPDQKAKIDVMHADLKAKMETIRSNAALTPEQKKDQFIALREANKAQFEAILTPDQLAQLQKEKADRQEHHHNWGAKGNAQAAPTP